MTHALVVYESMFGNTEALAQVVATGLSQQMTVDVLRARPDVVIGAGVDLLVLGAPTHAFGLSRPGTRAGAGEQGASREQASGPGLREWLAQLHAEPTLQVAVFDTRVQKRGVPGSAARVTARRIRRLGLPLLSPPMTFWVTGTPGPLLAGEKPRALRWGDDLARAFSDNATPLRTSRPSA